MSPRLWHVIARNYLMSIHPFVPPRLRTFAKLESNLLHTSNEMPQKVVSSSRELEFKSFQDWNGDHPSQTLIFHDDSSLWWIKVEIAWALPEPILKIRYLKRRSMFQEFIKAIDFGQLDLLDDTVTRISLTMTDQIHKPFPIRIVPNDYQTGANYFLSIAHRMSFQIGEDPGRTIYPALNQAQDLPTFKASLLKDHEVIAPAVLIMLY